jgi:TPR repeat protein
VPEAQIRLGDCYAAGHVFDHDLETARGCYAKAAAQGNAEASAKRDRLAEILPA